MTIKLADLRNSSTHVKIEDNNNISQNNEYAIIGMSCKFSEADNVSEYWDNLKNGHDCVREFPQNRVENNKDFLKFWDGSQPNDEYYIGGFLSEVDKFDYEFFKLSPLEASIMSVEQRLFLMTVWEAIEDAGYGGEKIKNTSTGIFLGHSTDFGISYKEFIRVLCPELMSVAISNNLNSIIASRISYLLNLKGPSMLIDTACSSSLVAVHMACRSIQNGDCDIAVAGSVKVDLLPLKSIKKREDEIGISSFDGKARTFDESSEGTGSGEGVAAILIKSLNKAQIDGDHIYAVIKGSAVNQDGNSLNLTAPNPIAQEKVIEKAWQNANINPETISYIEAHGTGTVLGDPIEVQGLSEAFRSCTEKKQFCGIGSVKTNLGHLDNAAGMAGLIKIILALVNKQIPPTLHFKYPNSKINFQDTPVYVNDVLREWKQAKTPRRCGISAFGLSGTNCHIVLEEYSQKKNRGDIEKGYHVLTISAKSKLGISELVWKYRMFLEKNNDINLSDLCYTASAGRGHYQYRLAVIFTTLEELLQKLEKYEYSLSNVLEQDFIYYKAIIIVADEQERRQAGEITEAEKILFTNQINRGLAEAVKEEYKNGYPLDFLKSVCKAYYAGADIDWELLYSNEVRQKLSIPVYPFTKKQCWVKKSEDIAKIDIDYRKDISYPLFVNSEDSYNGVLYRSVFNVKDFWILNEHKVVNDYVIAGTTYLEMIYYIVRDYYHLQMVNIQNVVFLTPLKVQENESVEVHSIIEKESEKLSFVIASKKAGTKDWTAHVKGKITLLVERSQEKLDIDSMKREGKQNALKYYAYEKGKAIKTGKRWDCVREIYIGKYGVLTYLSLSEEFKKELDIYQLHPALLDEAVNVLLRTVDRGIYLPFSYGSIEIYTSMPDKVYSLTKHKNVDGTDKEIATFDIVLTDEYGKVFAVIKDYSIKRVNEKTKIHYNLFTWKQEKLDDIQIRKPLHILIFRENEKSYLDIVNIIKNRRNNVVDCIFGEDFLDLSYNQFIIEPVKEHFEKLFKWIDLNEIDQIIYFAPKGRVESLDATDTIHEKMKNGVYGLCALVQVISRCVIKHKIDFVLVGENGLQVLDRYEVVKPENNALYCLAKGLRLEVIKLMFRCIDIEEATLAEIIYNEIYTASDKFMVAYRDRKRFVPMLRQLNVNNIRKLVINPKDVFVITGGLGALGLQCAQFLSEKAKVNIVLLHRSKFPGRDEWERILQSEEDNRLKEKIKQLKKIENNGSQIFLYQTDITDYEQVSKTFHDIFQQLKKINGVFHLAGSAGNGFIGNKSNKQIENVINPKILGVCYIDRIYKKYNFDFVILFSSISSLIAEAGQADYSAANGYLDAFSQYGRNIGRNYIAINWPAWSETGMAVDFHVDFDEEYFLPISNQNAFEVLEHVLVEQESNYVIGELDVERFTRAFTNLFEISPDLIKNTEHQEKDNSGDFVNQTTHIVLLGNGNQIENYTKTETILANIVGTVLGLEEINIYDSFTDLGVNSIIVVKIQEELEKVNINISLSELYKYKTIKALAASLVKEEAVVVLDKKESMLQNNYSNGIYGIVPFTDVFYKSCIYIDVFTIILSFKREISRFVVNDVFVYDYNEGCASVKNFMKKSITDVLDDMQIAFVTKSHNYKITKDYSLDDTDKKLLDQLRDFIGDSKRYSEESKNDIIEDIKEALFKQHPIIILVDCFYLSYRKETFEKEHWFHSLLLVGIDEKEKIFYTVEHMHRDSMDFDIRKVSFQDVLNAYEGFIRNYNWYVNIDTYYEFTERNQKNKKVEQNSIKINTRALYADTILFYKKDLINSMDNLKKIADAICYIILTEEHCKEKIKDVLILLNDIVNVKRIEKFINCTLFGVSSNFSKDMDGILEKWLYIRNKLVKFEHSSKYNKDKMIKLSQILLENIQNEMSYYKKLITYSEDKYTLGI